MDARLLEIVRHKMVAAARRAGITLKQTLAKEGKQLRRRAGGYAHARQFKRLRRVLKRQRPVLGIVLRECAWGSRAFMRARSGCWPGAAMDCGRGRGAAAGVRSGGLGGCVNFAGDPTNYGRNCAIDRRRLWSRQ